MTIRSDLHPVAIAAILLLAACGGGSDETSETVVTDAAATTDGTPVTEAPFADDAAPDADTEPSADDTTADGCDQVLTPAEVEAIFGVAPEINGQGERCTMVFADDAVGGMAAFSGSKADEAIETLLADYESDEYKTTNGTLLPDDRGYIVDGSLVVRGDSGRVFSLGIPDSLDTGDFSVAMQTLADLLLTR